MVRGNVYKKINKVARAVFNKNTAKSVLPVVILLFASPAFGQVVGGLQKVNAFASTILAVKHGVAIAAVTIAVMWTGFKMLFQHAAIRDCGRIIAACLLIGGAAELGAYFAS